MGASGGSTSLKGRPGEPDVLDSGTVTLVFRLEGRRTSSSMLSGSVKRDRRRADESCSGWPLGSERVLTPRVRSSVRIDERVAKDGRSRRGKSARRWTGTFCAWAVFVLWPALDPAQPLAAPHTWRLLEEWGLRLGFSSATGAWHSCSRGESHTWIRASIT